MRDKLTYNDWIKKIIHEKQKEEKLNWLIVDYYGADQATGKPRIIGEVLNTSYKDLDWSKIDEYQNYIKKI